MIPGVDPIPAESQILTEINKTIELGAFVFESGQVKRKNGIKLPVPAAFNDSTLFNIKEQHIHKTDKFVLKTFFANNYFALTAASRPDLGVWFQSQV